MVYLAPVLTTSDWALQRCRAEEAVSAFSAPCKSSDVVALVLKPNASDVLPVAPRFHRTVRSGK